MKLFKCLIPLLTVYAAGAYADVVVIVSAKSAVVRLTTEQTARIFLGKVNSFPDGSNAVPVDQPEGSAIRDEFYAKVANKNPSQLAAYWAKVIFTGGDSCPPKLIEGNVAARRAVTSNPNAIGYLDKSAVDSSVRVVLSP